MKQSRSTQRKRHTIFRIVFLLCVPLAAHAHFLGLIPSPPIVAAEGERAVALDIRFTHPMEAGPVMEMGRPVQFGVLVGGAKQDLRSVLQPVRIEGKTAYKASYKPKAPGDHVFYIEPAPYWEPGERKMIIHYTKVIVDAFGGGEGWDQMVGFPLEIEPLTRPYGLWAGNMFRGIVKQNGRPVPFATVEIEYWNDKHEVKPPADPFITQVTKADANGVFAYTMPRAGWWGFAALIDGDKKMKNPDGDDVDVELGALIWVHCVDMK